MPLTVLLHSKCIAFLCLGATLLDTILFSNKTQISAMTGHWQAHPLLISLANLDMDFCMKASHQVFVLLVLLPIPKFIAATKICSVLEACLIHKCLNLILEPLKTAARIGIMIIDPAGNSCYCFMLLASYFIDTPESALLASVAGKTSSVTMAS